MDKKIYIYTISSHLRNKSEKPGGGGGVGGREGGGKELLISVITGSVLPTQFRMKTPCHAYFYHLPPFF